MEPVVLAVTAGGFAGLGFVLGRWRPVLALTVFLCFLCITSSLLWQLGFENLTPSGVFLAGFVIARLLGRSGRQADQESGPAPRSCAGSIRAAGGFCALVIAISGTVSLLESFPPPTLLTGAGVVGVAGDLVRFDPDGWSALARAALVAVLGPAMFIVVVPIVGGKGAREGVEAAVSGSVALALVGVVVQLIWLDPVVRPDMNTMSGAFATGIVGMFQDPNSFAAFLVLAIGYCTGKAIAGRLQQSSRESVVHGCLAAGALLAILYTGSRGGLVATLVVATSMAALLSAGRFRTRAAVFDRGRALGAAAVVLAVVAAAGALVLSPLRAIPGQALRRAGGDRLAMLFELPDRGLDPYISRLQNWSTAAELIRARPLWGVGPRAFVTAAVERGGEREVGSRPARRAGAAGDLLRDNAHNYYLQLGAELGVPALLSFVWLCVATVVLTAGAALTCSDGHRAARLGGIASGQIGFLGLCVIGHPLLIVELQGFYWVLTGLGVALASKLSDDWSGFSTSQPRAVSPAAEQIDER